MYKTIIVAVDLSEQDIVQPALAAAVALSDAGVGRLHLVYVRHPLPGSPMAAIAGDIVADSLAQYEEMMNAVKARLDFSKERLTSAILNGAVYAEILEEAKRISADLIVVAAHAPSMATYLLGSNAAKIVRHAECSTLVVRTGKKASLLG
ncbi:MAG: universal stress protein [Proteobacteria bacterium]|nr:universal stress protein [Pseudomonadota bacterium]